MFPVLGDVSFTDDYGAPRAVTGWHHGNDLFADTGTPLLAVTDGTLGRVGVNTLGGNRLWLTDGAGNQFYYAHMSGYAPGAVNGARVRAGEVIGFVGNTGQAITTPPHLHFEIHPGGGDSVNPYPYLIAWQRGAPVARAFRVAESVGGSAPAPGDRRGPGLRGARPRRRARDRRRSGGLGPLTRHPRPGAATWSATCAASAGPPPTPPTRRSTRGTRSGPGPVRPAPDRAADGGWHAISRAPRR